MQQTDNSARPGSGVSYRSTLKIASELLWSDMAEISGKYAHGKLVDLGCGTKPYEPLLIPFVDSYFGVDWEAVSEGHYGADTRADYYADCTDTKLPAESFDTLVSTQVMEHIYDTDAYLRECNRLLRKGGVGIFSVPFVWETHAEPHDFFRFTRYSLEKKFEQHGFSIERLEPLGGAYATLIQLKIVSLYYRPVQSFPYRAVRRLKNELLIPVLNFMALHFDRIFWNDKLCMYYSIVVRKR